MATTKTVTSTGPATANGAGKPAPKTPEQRAQEKRERFKRLAPQRVQKALKRICQVENLGNRATYTYTAEEAEKIFDALYDAIVAVKQSFSGQTRGEQVFTL